MKMIFAFSRFYVIIYTIKYWAVRASFCLQVEWGEKPRESVTVMSGLYGQNKSGLPRTAPRLAETGAETCSTPENVGGFVSVQPVWQHGFLLCMRSCASGRLPARRDGSGCACIDGTQMRLAFLPGGPIRHPPSRTCDPLAASGSPEALPCSGCDIQTL